MSTTEHATLPDGRAVIVYVSDAHDDPIVFGWCVLVGNATVIREGRCGTKDEARREARNVVEHLKANPPDGAKEDLRKRLEKSWGWL
jgi:hypothetical protein